MKEVILLKLGEIVLKGLNRNTFENALIKNIRRRLAPLGEFEVRMAQSTITITPSAWLPGPRCCPHRKNWIERRVPGRHRVFACADGQLCRCRRGSADCAQSISGRSLPDRRSPDAGRLHRVLPLKADARVRTPNFYPVW